MPLYTFRCIYCGYEFDEIRSVSARKNPGICPECGQKAVLTWAPPATPVLNPARPVKPRKGGFA